jgi:hypothetical protein
MAGRKHPIKHIVKGHKKTDGTIVRTYKRGAGGKVVKTKKGGPAMAIGPKAFTANFIYSNKKDDGESVVVIADSYASALDEAYEERTSRRTPIAVDLIDPSISSVLSFIGNTAKEAATRGVQAIRKHGETAVKLGAKYAVKGGNVAFDVAKKGTKAGAQALKATATEYVSKVEQENVRKLINAAYSSDRIKRNAARTTIKNFYPEVYDIMDFSEPSFDNSLALRKLARQAKAEHKGISLYLDRSVAEEPAWVGVNKSGGYVYGGGSVPINIGNPISPPKGPIDFGSTRSPKESQVVQGPGISKDIAGGGYYSNITHSYYKSPSGKSAAEAKFQSKSGLQTVHTGMPERISPPEIRAGPSPILRSSPPEPILRSPSTKRAVE